MSNLDMTTIITILAGVILVLQSIYIALALKKGMDRAHRSKTV